MAAKLPADAMIVSAIGGASRFSRCTVRLPGRRRSRSAAPRAEDRPQAERGQRGEDDAGSSGSPAAPARVEAEGRRVAAVARQVANGHPGHQPDKASQGIGHHAGPSPVKSSAAGRRTRTAGSGSPRQEAVGDGGDRHAKDCRQHQRRQIRPRADDHHGLQLRWRRRRPVRRRRFPPAESSATWSSAGWADVEHEKAGRGPPWVCRSNADRVLSTWSPGTNTSTRSCGTTLVDLMPLVLRMVTSVEVPGENMCLGHR